MTHWFLFFKTRLFYFQRWHVHDSATLKISTICCRLYHQFCFNLPWVLKENMLSCRFPLLWQEKFTNPCRCSSVGFQTCLSPECTPLPLGRHGQVSRNCRVSQCVRHWLTMKTVMELPLIPEMAPPKSFRTSTGSLLMFPCEDNLQALWLLAHRHLQ